MFATLDATVYAIWAGRQVRRPLTVLGADVNGVVIRDGRVEQAIRPAAVTRKVCGGNRTRQGRRVHHWNLELAPLFATMLRAAVRIVPD